MIKIFYCLSALLSMVVPLTALAIQLDCEKNSDGTYTCIEIGKPSHSSTSSSDTNSTESIDPGYLEQARKECTYQNPRKWKSGQKHGAAQKMEQEKAARKEYQDCLSKTAARIRNAENQ